jgi:hypothetical protein
MTRSQAVAIGLNVVNGVIQFALVTQQDVTLPPLVKFVLGATAVGVGIVLTMLRIQPAPPAIRVPGGGEPVVGDGK